MTDSSPETSAEQAVKLPAGFEVLTADEDLAVEVYHALNDVEERLLQALSSPDQTADSSARYLAEAGGKRVRPLLTVLTSMLGEGAGPEVLQAAVVMFATLPIIMVYPFVQKYFVKGAMIGAVKG